MAAKSLKDKLSSHQNYKKVEDKVAPDGIQIDAEELLMGLVDGEIETAEIKDIVFNAAKDLVGSLDEITESSKKLHKKSIKVVSDEGIFFYISRLTLAILAVEEMDKTSKAGKKEKISSLIHAISVFLAKLDEEGLIEIKSLLGKKK
jgi:hypothetical protein